MKAFTSAALDREDDLLDTIITITKNTPNDAELGKEIRQLFNA